VVVGEGEGASAPVRSNAWVLAAAVVWELADVLAHSAIEDASFDDEKIFRVYFEKEPMSNIQPPTTNSTSFILPSHI
jgi:hypothetical protein